MENIKIEQYKEFKKNYKFNLRDNMAILEKVKLETWEEKTRLEAEGNFNRILNSSRPKKDIENTILYDYCFMLMCFMKDRPKTFDTILNHMQENKHNYMGIEVLEQMASGL